MIKLKEKRNNTEWQRTLEMKSMSLSTEGSAYKQNYGKMQAKKTLSI